MTGGAALRFLTFHIDQRLYALPAEDVHEVIRLPAVARVPRAPVALLGFASHRGSVIPLASLRGLLGLPAGGASSASRAIVLDRGALVGIAVDRTDALVEIAADSLKTRQRLAEEPGERLNGAFELGPRIAKVLDIQGLLEAAFARRARPRQQFQTRVRAAGGAVAEIDPVENLLTFDVADQEYALGLDSVREIVPTPDSVTKLSRDETVVLGMMALRGEILPLLSLRGLLGFAGPGKRDRREKVVIANVGGALVGLIADRVREVVAAESRRIDPLPTLLATRIGGEAKIKAVYRAEAGRRLISILAPDQLFREDVMQRLGSTPAAAAGKIHEVDTQARAPISFLVFRLGGDEFALPIEAIDEVRRAPDRITRVPKSPKFLEGVVNVRGDILPVIDQRRRFGMPDSEEKKKNRRLIVVWTRGNRTAIIVDSVSEVLSRPADSIEEAPGLSDDVERLVRGVINLEKEGRIVLVLDPSELLSQAENELVGALAPSSNPELA